MLSKLWFGLKSLQFFISYTSVLVGLRHLKKPTIQVNSNEDIKYENTEAKLDLLIFK